MLSQMRGHEEKVLLRSTLGVMLKQSPIVTQLLMQVYQEARAQTKLATAIGLQQLFCLHYRPPGVWEVNVMLKLEMTLRGEEHKGAL